MNLLPRLGLSYSTVLLPYTTQHFEIESWKNIPWLKPPRPITPADLAPLLARWYDALAPYRATTGSQQHVTLPRVARIVTDLKEAKRYAAASAAAASAAAAAATAAAAIFRGYGYWYTRPYYALRQVVWWMIGGLPGTSPAAPLVEIYRLGCMPIGYCLIDGKTEFVVWCPNSSINEFKF